MAVRAGPFDRQPPGDAVRRPQSLQPVYWDELQAANQAALDRLRAEHPDWANGDAPSTRRCGWPVSQHGIGHSYGSTLTGAAGLDGNHLDANNLVAVGSPGILADNASDLSLAPGANVFASRAENDIIGIATYATLGPDPMARQSAVSPFRRHPAPPVPRAYRRSTPTAATGALAIRRWITWAASLLETPT